MHVRQQRMPFYLSKFSSRTPAESEPFSIPLSVTTLLNYRYYGFCCHAYERKIVRTAWQHSHKMVRCSRDRLLFLSLSDSGLAQGKIKQPMATVLFPVLGLS